MAVMYGNMVSYLKLPLKCFLWVYLIMMVSMFQVGGGINFKRNSDMTDLFIYFISFQFFLFHVLTTLLFDETLYMFFKVDFICVNSDNEQSHTVQLVQRIYTKGSLKYRKNSKN